MSRAFVVRLRTGSDGQVVGRVQEVDTGVEALVRSADELLAVLLGPADRAHPVDQALPCPTTRLPAGNPWDTDEAVGTDQRFEEGGKWDR